MSELPTQEKNPQEPAKRRVWGGAQEGAGRPPMQFSDEQRKLVESMSGYGVPQADIAALVGESGISIDTLRAHFRKELDQGRAKANAKVGQTLFQKATGGDTASLIWWSKAQMRWREEVNTQVAAPVTINLAWLPGRGVDAGYSTSGAQIIDAEAQPIEYIEQKDEDLRVTDTKDAG